MISLTATTASGDSAISELIVPVLEVEPDPVRGEVRLRAVPGAAAGVSISKPDGTGINRQVTLPADGLLVIRGEDDRPLDLPPGTSVTASLRSPEGHYVRRGRTLAHLSIPTRGATICGWSLPDADISAEVERDGSILGSASARADGIGRFVARVRDARGVEVGLSAGDRVVAFLGSERVEAVLGPLDGRPDWPSGTFGGTAPPENAGRIEIFEQPSCAPSAPHYRWGAAWRSDADGRMAEVDISWVGFGLVDPRGLVYEIAFDHPGGVRQFRLVRSLRVEVVASTPDVRGEASAGEVVTVHVHGPDDVVRGSAVAVANGDGLWSAIVRDVGGSAVSAREGDKVVVASEHEHADLRVTRLGFDLVGDRLLGVASPRQYISVTYGLDDIVRGGRAPGDADEVRMAIFEADIAGRFEIPLSSPRSGWGDSEVDRVRSAVILSGRHELLAEWVRPFDLGDSVRRIFLPWATLRR